MNKSDTGREYGVVKDTLVLLTTLLLGQLVTSRESKSVDCLQFAGSYNICAR